MKLSEHEIMNLAIKKRPMLFRNDNGKAWVGGRVEHINAHDLCIFNPKRIAYGLYKGSGDLVGWEEKTITPEMIGQKIAVFCSVEVKTHGDTIKQDQKNWHNVVKRAGGISEIWIEKTPGKIEVINEL